MIEDKFAAVVRKYPEHVAISDGIETITYCELYSQKQGYFQYLRQVLHLQKGERIALFLPNCVEFIFLFFAIADVGAIAVPLNIHLKENELQYYIVKCGITVVVTNSDLLTQWGEMPSQGQGVKFILIDRLEIPQKKRGICSPWRMICIIQGQILLILKFFISALQAPQVGRILFQERIPIFSQGEKTLVKLLK
jgi:acyl-CoA synthetase (AMP-forming)/AMP-acid ligase II